MKAITPYRKLQERVKDLQERVKDLEEISKGHQQQVGFLLTQLNVKEKYLQDFKNEVKEELKDFNPLCHILTISKFLDCAREHELKQARDIVDINYVA